MVTYLLCSVRAVNAIGKGDNSDPIEFAVQQATVPDPVEPQFDLDCNGVRTLRWEVRRPLY